MRILALSPLDRDATASLYVDGNWLAIAEERLSRVRMHAGFPHRAIRELFERAGVRPDHVDQVVYPFMPWWVEGSAIARGYLEDLFFTFTNHDPWIFKARHLRTYLNWCLKSIREHRHFHHELTRGLDELGLAKRLSRVEHHCAHAAAAYLTSGYESALALTLDWYGGGLSGSVSRCEGRRITRLHHFEYPHSLGLFFSQVTSALGFTAGRHEGKIVGLAAFGDSRVLGERVLARFIREQGDFHYRSGMSYEFAAALAKDFAHQDVAAAYQHVLETVVLGITRHWLEQSGLQDVVLAGGVAANVKMNQRINELGGVRRVFVHPNMGDGGAGVGATLAFLLEHGHLQQEEWRTCFLGSSYSTREIGAALHSAGLMARASENIALDIARRIAGGKVVARFNGAMEYGPRALGNRSILYQATDPAVNDWLNRRLGRTEFMPFAPATLFEHRHQRYVDIDSRLAASRFMTITCSCTDLMRRESPAAVHVDGTARPQIVKRDDNPDLHAILSEYHKMTGIPTLINTSFNMHEEPLVCSPGDAIRAFLQAKLDCLAIGPYMIDRECASRPPSTRALETVQIDDDRTGP